MRADVGDLPARSNSNSTSIQLVIPLLTRCTPPCSLVDHRYVPCYSRLSLANLLQLQLPTPHNQNPLHQQTRPQSNQPIYQAPHPPRSQIEAMPPFAQTLLQPSASPQLLHSSFHSPAMLHQFLQSRPVYDPATCHPVFFTQSLRRPPFSFVDSGGSGAQNPVAFGYVAEQVGGGVKGAKL